MEPALFDRILDAASRHVRHPMRLTTTGRRYEATDPAVNRSLTTSSTAIRSRPASLDRLRMHAEGQPASQRQDRTPFLHHHAWPTTCLGAKRDLGFLHVLPQQTLQLSSFADPLPVKQLLQEQDILPQCDPLLLHSADSIANTFSRVRDVDRPS